MIEPSTSRSPLGDLSARDRRATNGPAQVPSREFARVLENQAQGRTSMNDSGGTRAFSEGGLFQRAVSWRSNRAKPTIATGVLDEQQGADAVDADERPYENANDVIEPFGATKVAADAPRTDPKAAQRPITAQQQVSPSETSLPSPRRSQPQPSSVQQQPRAGSGARLLNRTVAASLPLHVAVAAIEHGVVVRIATTALEDAERSELADRIAELLARHGYASATVSVNGVTTLLPSHKGQDTWR